MNSKFRQVLVGSLAALCCANACSGDEPRSRALIRGEGGDQAAGGAGGGGKQVDPATAGAIRGTVHFAGTPPPLEPITFSQEICAEPHSGTVYKETVVVNPNNTLRWCFVYVDTADQYAPPAQPALIDQIGCIYIPHVLGMQVNQKIEVKSSDKTLHNFHWVSKPELNKEKNLAFTRPGSKTLTFAKAEVAMYVKCDVHPWMGAYIGIMTHPFHAVSDENGVYTIQGVPPGTHTVRLFHEVFSRKSDLQGTVTVTTGQTATLDFTVKN